MTRLFVNDNNPFINPGLFSIEYLGKNLISKVSIPPLVNIDKIITSDAIKYIIRNPLSLNNSLKLDE